MPAVLNGSIVLGSGYGAFLTYLENLPGDISLPSGSLFAPPTVNGTPLSNYLGQNGALNAPLRLSNAEIALSYADSPIEYLLIEGSSLSFPINGKELDQLGGNVASAQIYSGGSYSNGAVTGGVELGAFTFSATQWALTAGTASLTISGSDLPTNAGVFFSIGTGTYTGGPIAISQIQVVDGGTTATLGLTTSALTLSVSDPGAGDSYTLTLDGTFPDSLTATQIDDLVNGSGFQVTGPVGLSEIQYTANGAAFTILLSSTSLTVSYGDYELALTGSFPTGLTAAQVNAWIDTGTPPAGAFAGSVTSAVVTQISTGAVVESVTSAAPGGVALSGIGGGGGGVAGFVQGLFAAVSQSVTSVTVSGTLVVSSGAADFGDSVTPNGFEIVSSGGATQAISISGSSPYAGDANLGVRSGGSAYGVFVEAGGNAVISSGGSAAEIFVSSGGRASIHPGANVSGVTIMDGGEVAIWNNETIPGLVLSAGAEVTDWYEVFSGQSLTGVVLGSNGGAIVDVGGSAANLTVTSDAQLTVLGSDSGAFVAGYEDVEGLDVGATVSGDYSYQYIDVGASATSTTLEGVYGYQAVAGFAGSVRVLSGGEEDIESGGLVSGLTLMSGGSAYVLQGGVASGIVVSGGALYGYGGVTNLVTISATGNEEVYSGSAINVLIAGGGEDVFGGASTSQVTVASGSQRIEFGAVARATFVESGGTEIVFANGVASGTVVSSGGTLVVNAGADLVGVTVDSGGVLQLISPTIGYGSGLTAGPVDATTLISGNGGDTVLSGAVVGLSGATVNYGGTETVLSGGVANATTVLRGGVLNILAGAYASGVTVSSGGEVMVWNGQNVPGLVLLPGAIEITGEEVSSGSTAPNYQVAGGGQLLVDSGGLWLSGTVQAGGVATVHGADSGGTIQGQEYLYGSAGQVTIENGGVETVEPGGFASGVLVTAGGEQVLSGGSTSNVTIQLGSQYVESGAVAYGVTLSSGANQYVYVGGVASGATILSGAQQDDYGSAAGVTIQSGGVDYVFGSASGVTVSSGGQIQVDGGSASQVTVLSGAFANVYGALSGVVVSSGGVLYLGSGANVTGATLEPGAIVSGLYDPVIPRSASISPSNELLVSVGPTLVETIGLGSGANDLSVEFGSLLLGYVEFVVTTEPASATFGTVSSGGTAAYSTDALLAPGGALLASEAITSSGTNLITQYLTSTGAQFAATIQQTLGAETILQDFNGAWAQQAATITYAEGGGSTLVETFDGAWDHIGAVSTQVNGGETIVQTFDGAFNQLSASITTTPAAGVSITQYFNSAWSQTSAAYVTDGANGSVRTQYFNSAWQQTSATQVTELGGGELETQSFNGSWQQTSATIVQHPSAGVTITQNFDSAWDQLSADILTVSGAVSTDQTFNGSWQLTGGTVSTQLSPTTELVQTYDSSWDRLLGEDRLIVTATSGLESFADTPGAPTTWVFQPGQINGDAFSGFVTSAMDPSAHDVLEFVGYGPTATLTQIDASHWQITAQGHATEVFTLAANLNPAAGDVVFR
jgi:autotransporter passenger strand-loop-strand repeat protein